MPLEIGRCLDVAWKVFSKNWVTWMIAGFLSSVLSAVTFLILVGPLTAGLCLMALKALSQPDERIELGDLFSSFNRFLSALGLFLVTSVAVFIGLSICVFPGLLLSTCWIFAYMLFVDQNAGVYDSLGRSYTLAKQAGFWQIFCLMLVHLALNILPVFVPFLGTIVSFATIPIASLYVAAAYRQLTGQTTPQVE